MVNTDCDAGWLLDKTHRYNGSVRSGHKKKIIKKYWT